MTPDTFTARVAVLTLAIALLGLIAAISVLAHEGKEVPAVLAGALGLVLGGLLPSPITKAGPPAPDINVNNAAVDPEVTAAAVARRLQAAKRTGRAQKGEVGCALALFGLVVLILWLVGS